MWMMAAMLATTAISTAMSAKGAIDEGIAGQNAANLQATAARRAAMEAEEQAKDITLQAAQDEQARMDKLQGILGASAVAGAASGITSDSGTLEAIQQSNREIVGRDIMNVSYNANARAAALRRQAQYGREAGATFEQAGREAYNAGQLKMYGTIFRGASGIATNAYFGNLWGGSTTMGGTGGPAAGSSRAAREGY